MFNPYLYISTCGKRLLVLCFLMALAPSSLCSSSPHVIRFNYLTTEMGLSNNAISSEGQTIVQDKNGFLWFATQDGLNRFDGYNIKTYRHDPANPHSLLDNFVTTLYEDRQGFIWVGTYYGLDRFDPTTERFTHFSPGHSTNPILAIIEDQPGALWIGTEHGLQYLKTASGRFRYYRHDKSDPHSLSNDFVKAVLKDSQGTLWVGTDDGLDRFDPATGRFVHFRSARTDSHSLSSDSIYTLHEDRRGNLWVGTNNGLNRMGPARRRFIRYLEDTGASSTLSANHIVSIVEDRQGQLWIGIYAGGIARLNPETGDVYHYPYKSGDLHGLSSNNVAALFIDRQNKLWVGTLGDGICYFSLNASKWGHQKIFTEDNGSQALLVALIEDRRKTLWAGVYGGGVSRYNPDTGQLKHYYHDDSDPYSLSDSRVMALYEDSRETMWVGTSNGLNRFDATRERFVPYKNGALDILAIAEDHEGRLWIGSLDAGLSWLDRDSGQLVRFNGGQIDWGVRVLHAGRDGTLWIGSTRGLTRLRQDKTLTHYRHNSEDPDSISHDHISSIYQDSRGLLWVGTFGGGLNRFDINTERFHRYSESDGLASSTVYGILEDDQNNLWVSTTQGLSRLNPETETFTNYSMEDGLQDNEFNQGAFTKSRSGELLFGGINGFNRFHPEEIRNAPAVPPEIRFTDFRLFNKSVPIGDERQGKTDQFRLTKAIHTQDALRLTHKESFFTFEFAAINALKPKSIQYAYKLQGWDKDWIYTDHTNRLATYTNISAGDYILQVRAIDQDGQWGESSAAIVLTILPPWWKSAWAFLLYALLGIIAIFLTIWLRTRALQLHARQLEKTVLQRTRTIEALLTKKEELFANISHEFRTPLTLITGPISQVLRESRSKKIKAVLTPTLINARRLLRMVDQLLDLARLDSPNIEQNTRVNVSALLENIHMSMHSLFQERELSTSTFIEPGLVVNAGIDALEKIIVNLLSNAIKYTPRGGHIEICARASDDVVHFSIKDNGVGIAPQEQEKIFNRFVRLSAQTEDRAPGAGIGLALVKQLVHFLNGSISVDSERGEGACFTVSLPLAGTEVEGEKDTVATRSQSVEQEIEALREARLPSNASDSGDSCTQEDRPRVLIVEDHPEMRGFIQQALSSQYRCFLADDGLSGIKTALEEVPELIITDLMMPNKSGFELANVVRNDTRTSHIPIIMLTAKADEQSRLQAWKSDIDDYVEKPFDAGELLLRCENLISIRRILSQRLGTALSYTAAADIPALHEKDRAFVENLRELVTAHYTDSQLNATMISRELAMSESQLQRKIKALLGQSVPDYIRSFRLQKGAELLQQKGTLITEVAYQVGFSSPNYFSSCFKAHYGITPKAYQAG